MSLVGCLRRKMWSSLKRLGNAVNRGVFMDNNKWERRLDNYLDFLESPLAATAEIRRDWGTFASIIATPFATALFLIKAILTFPWGIFLVIARFFEA